MMSPRLGRNERCWCGSGKKYKRCHLGRESQIQPGKQEVIENFYRVYENGHCLHPMASSDTCSDKIIQAHTIQRNGGLSKIARKGHVFSLLKHGSFFDKRKWESDSGPNRVGIGEASTFTGFCARHDDELFAPIEKMPFVGTSKQVALLGYRALCYELFMKRSDMRITELRRDSDKGQPLWYQKLTQESIFHYKSGLRRSIQEIEGSKGLYDQVLFQNSFDILESLVVHFDVNPEVQCSGIVQATHDFRGNLISDLANLEQPASWVSFSLIPTDSGGAAVFSWPASHLKSAEVMQTLYELSNSALPHAIIRFAFEFFENTYFSPEWWEGLEESARISLKQRQLRELVGPFGELEFPRPDDCLSDDGFRAVHWPIVSRTTAIAQP